MSKHSQYGFSLILVVLVVTSIVIVSAVGYLYVTNFVQTDFNKDASKTQSNQTPNSSQSKIEVAKVTDKILWSFNGKEWLSSGQIPACAEPLDFKLPSNIDTATSTIWPGQTRGNDFKPHGGVRHDSSFGKTNVRAPMDGVLYRAANYIQDNEIQYMIEVIDNCGVAYRMDHLRVLSPKLSDELSKLHKPTHSSATSLTSPVFFEQDELIATEIGFKNTQNYFYDLGVYDLREKNKSAKNKTWASNHNAELGHYAICWFDLLPSKQNKKLRDLPTGNEGKVSDYCN